MLIRKVIYKKGITKIENIATSPFLRSKWTEFWEKMYTTTDIGKGNDTTNTGPIWLFLRRNLVQEMIRFRVIWKRGIPFNVGKMLGNFRSI